MSHGFKELEECRDNEEMTNYRVICKCGEPGRWTNNKGWAWEEFAEHLEGQTNGQLSSGSI
jgi:hypothetical protein